MAAGGGAAAGALLEPLYRAEGAHAALAEVRAARLAPAALPTARAAAQVELAALRGGPLGDPEGGFLGAARALEDDPDSAAALDLAVRLATEAGLEDALADVLAGPAERAAEAGQRAAARRALARLAGDPARAAAAWAALLELAPADPEALAGLAAAYRTAGDQPALAAALRRRLEAAPGPVERAALLDELAAVELARGDPAAAAAALQARADLAPDDRALLARLDEALAAAGDLAALEDVVARELALAAAAGDREAALLLRARRAGLREERGDRAGALALYEEVLAERPADPAALAGLERLVEDDPADGGAAAALVAALERGDDAERLAAALDRLAAASAAGPGRKAALARLAGLREERLASPALAFGALLRAFREDPADRALRASLARLASEAGAEEELAAAWEEAAEALPAPDAVELQLELGALWDRLGAPARAVEWLARARRADPARAAPCLAALDRLCAAAERWAEEDEVLDALAARAEGTARAALLARQAALREARLADPEGARASAEAALAADPGDLPALRVRARLALAAGDAGPQVDLAAALAAAGERTEAAAAARAALGAGLDLEAHAERLDAACAAAGAPAERAAIAELGAARHEAAGRAGAAAAAWLEAGRRHDEAGVAARATDALERALAADPACEEAFALLRARLAAAGDPAALARLLADQAERAADADARRALHAEAGELLERLGQPELALIQWCRALQCEPLDASAAAAAGRLAAAGGALDELAALWEGIAEQHQGAARVHALCALGRLRAGPLGDAAGAEAAWRAALEADPAAGEPREALAAALATEGRQAELAALLEWTLGAARGPARAALLRRLAALREQRLGDAAGALDAWRALAATEPGAADAAAGVERLAEQLGRWQELHDALAARAAAAPALLARCADLCEERLGDLDRAVAHAEALLDADPASAAALERLARLHGRRGEPARRAAALERHALLAADAAERAALWLAAAGTRRELGDRAGAERALRDALRAAPASRPALAALAALHEEAGDAALALDALERLAAAAPDDAEAADAWARAARVHARRGDDAAARAAWRRVADAAPAHLEALRALRAAAERDGDRATARGLLEREALACAEPAERARLCGELARVHRDGRGDAVAAARWLAELLAAAPDDGGAARALADLHLAGGDAAAAEPLYALAAAADPGAAGPREAARRWHRLALARERLGRADEALEAERRACRADPGYLPAALGLPARLAAAGEREEALAALGALVAGHAAALTAAELGAAHRQAGELEALLGRPARAAAAFERALEVEPGRLEALAGLEPLLAAAGRWRDLERHYRAALALLPAGDGAEGTRRALWRALASLYAGPLADAGAARAAAEVLASIEAHAGTPAGG
jgi:tetratricopeptide (TPR) repeat protein